MSLHISEPASTHPANRMFRIWTCDIVETATGAIVETSAPQTSPMQAQVCAARLLARLKEEFPTRLKR